MVKDTNIAIRNDNTEAQLSELKALKETLETRQRNGETNLRISYANGKPRITKKSKN